MRPATPILAGLALLLVVSQARAESRTVLIQVKQDGQKKASVTIRSDEKKEQKSAVSVDEAVKVIGEMKGWGSTVGVHVTSERGIPRTDLKKLLAVISDNPWLELEYFGREVPKRVGDHFLRGQAPPPAKEPWAGEPVVPAKWVRGGKLSTFKRLPKADAVTALRITAGLNRTAQPLTAANFPAVLDSMKPVRADDPGYKEWSHADWYSADFETPEGRFQVTFHLGELALLVAPDGSVGLVTFEQPPAEELKRPLPGGSAALPDLVPECKGALVATLQEVGAPELGPPGAAYHKARWKVDKVLRGTYPAIASMTFRVQSIPEKSRERAPAVGKTYFLITDAANGDQIVAILEANEANLRKVQTLLRR